MRYAAGHKEKTRDRVLRVAAKAIRKDGPHRIGVGAVMARAGLTHGGFYAHFASKDDLVVAAIGRMFDEARALLARASGVPEPAARLAGYVDFYLSAEHCDARASGCPMPALAADVPRLGRTARERFAAGIEGMRAAFAEPLRALGRADADDVASSVVAELVGALSLARAEPDAVRSAAILERSRRSIFARLDLEFP